MSGMCERSAFDTFYHMYNDENGLVTFYGFDSSLIRYDTKERLWVLNIINKPDLCPPEKTQHPSLVVTSLLFRFHLGRGVKKTDTLRSG